MLRRMRASSRYVVNQNMPSDGKLVKCVALNYPTKRRKGGVAPVGKTGKKEGGPKLRNGSMKSNNGEIQKKV